MVDSIFHCRVNDTIVLLFCKRKNIIKRMKKRILIAGANPYNANKGVAALAISTMRILNRVSKDIGIEIEICCYNHEHKTTYDSIETPEGVIAYKNIYPSRLRSLGDCIKTFTSKWRLYNLRELFKCDYILNVSAGDSFSDIYGDSNFYSQNEINRLARLLNIKYTFLPQTIGPFFSEGIKKAAITSLKGADRVLSRDKESTIYVNSLMPDKQVEDLIDVAFCLPYKRMALNSVVDGLHIGINISQTLWNKPSDNKFNVSQSYPSLMREVIQGLLSRGYYVHIVPHVVDADNNNSNEYYVSYTLWKEVSHPRLILAPFFTSPIEAKSYMSSLDMFIGARMHACIGAFSSGVPTLLLAYSRKFSGLFKETLGYNYIADMSSDVDSDRLLNLAEDMIVNRNEIRKQIQTIGETIVNQKLTHLFEVIGQILKSI